MRGTGWSGRRPRCVRNGWPWQLGTEDRTSGEARKLFARLEAARLELESIRSGGIETVWTAESEWLQKLGWPCGAETPPG